MGAEARSKLGAFLRDRRNLLQPEDVGLPREPGRRVTGLRRAEIAAFAGISEEYYLRLEQGRDHQPSVQVLDALGRALRLDPAATRYLYRLSGAARAHPESLTSMRSSLPEDAAFFHEWPDTAAFIVDSNRDVLASNALALKLSGVGFSVGTNRLIHTFRDEPRDVDKEWESRAALLLAEFRFHGDPASVRYQEIVGELSMRDSYFAYLWARHDVAIWPSGSITLQIEPFGPVGLEWLNFTLPGRPGTTLVTLFPDPGSPAVSALAYLAAA